MMKIAICQTAGRSGGVEPNLDLLADAAAHAATQAVQLLIMPEMFLTGYHIGRESVNRLAEPADGASTHRIDAIARDTGVAILYGYPERAGGEVFNAARLVDSSGNQCMNYRKTHLFGTVDRSCFSAGDSHSPIVDIDGLRVGVLICYDLEFAENARLLALAGAELIAVPTAQMHPYAFVPQTLVAARAFENQVFVAYANRCGRERDFDYTGLSSIVAPDGSDLARAGDGEDLIVATLDKQCLADSRRLNTFLRDRRPELYADLANTDR
ncbi:carbon-nitrogen hydrolase family protein [Rhodocyclaceae bacterium SMB388]